MQSAQVIEFIETYVRIPEGRAVGQPMRLMEWQKDFLRKVFDNPHGTRRAILSVAALLLAYIVGPLASQNAQVYSAAQSREQAALVFNLMAKMTRMSPDLAQHVVIRDSARELLCTLTGVRFRALSADAATAMGTSPVAFVFDEIGQVVGPHCPLFDALHSGQGAHADPIEFVISTQASSDTDFFSQMVDDAGDDPHTVCVVYEAPTECDLLDESAWRAANPALGTIVTADYVRGLAEEATRMPSREPQFRNLILNQRVEATSPFVSRSVWKLNAAELMPYVKGPVYAGLDLSSVADLTALVLVWRHEKVWQVLPYFWTPKQGLNDRARRDHAAYDDWVRKGYVRATPGATVDYDEVAAEILELTSDFDVKAIAFDRWRFDVLKAALTRKGAPESFMARLQPFGQGFQSMSPAVEALEGELLNARIAHGDHPVLQMCAANAVIVRDPAGNRKLDKAKSTGRIDGLVALAMAMGAASRDGPAAPAAPAYQLFFV
jgi:phage terminase large subunit-like protein